MTGNLQTAFMLLAVGMITVFSILFLLVIISKLMIFFINRYFPEDLKLIGPKIKQSSASLGSSKVTAIVAAIDLITEGRGTVRRIESINKNQSGLNN